MLSAAHSAQWLRAPRRSRKEIGGGQMLPWAPAKAPARALGLSLTHAPVRKGWRSHLARCSGLGSSTLTKCRHCLQGSGRGGPHGGRRSCKGTSACCWAVTHPCTCQEGLAQASDLMQYARQLPPVQVLPLQNRSPSSPTTARLHVAYFPQAFACWQVLSAPDLRPARSAAGTT